jgi:ribosomal protein S20
MPKYITPTGAGGGSFSLKALDLSKIENVPGYVKNNGVVHGVGAGAAIGLPFAVVAVLMPPPISMFLFGAAAITAGLVSASTIFKYNSKKEQWVHENRHLFIDQTNVIDGKAEEVEVVQLSTKDKIEKNRSDIKAALKNEVNNLSTEELKTKAKTAFKSVINVIDDYIENNIHDALVKKFVLIDSAQYLKAFLSYTKVRARKVKTDSCEDIAELDGKYSDFLDKIIDHIASMKEHALEEEVKSFAIDMRVAESIMEESVAKIAERVRAQIENDEGNNAA